MLPSISALMPISKAPVITELISAQAARRLDRTLATKSPVDIPEMQSESMEKMPRHRLGDASIYAIGENAAAHTAYVISAQIKPISAAENRRYSFVPFFIKASRNKKVACE